MEGQWQSNVVEESARERCNAVLIAIAERKGIGHLLDPPFELPVSATCDLHTVSPMATAAMAGDVNALRAIFQVTPKELFVVSGCAIQTPGGHAVLNGNLDAARWIWMHCQFSLLKVHGFVQTVARQGNAPMLQWLFSLGPSSSSAIQMISIWRNLLQCVNVSDRMECAVLVASLGKRFASLGLALSGAFNDVPLMSCLIKSGASVRSLDYEYMRVTLKLVESIQMIYNLSISHIEETAGTILKHAIQLGSPMCVQKLLQDGVVPHIPNTEDWQQPLWVACTGLRDNGTDHSVDIVNLLLQSGAKAWLHDARGTRLKDVIQTGYWFITGPRYESMQHAFFSFPENQQRMAYSLKKSMLHWTPWRHFMFSPAFHRQCKSFLMCNYRLRTMGQSWLIRDVLFIVFEWLAVSVTNDNAPFENSLGHLKKTQLEALVKTTPIRKKILKRELVQTAVAEHVNEEERRVRRRFVSETLPEIIGRIECRLQDGTVLSYQIPRPNEKPWVNIGRAYTMHPGKGAFADFNLHSVPHNRRISRLHVSLRFNVMVSVWEIRVHGQNGIKMGEENLIIASNQWLWLPKTLVFEIPVCNLTFQVFSNVPFNN